MKIFKLLPFILLVLLSLEGLSQEIVGNWYTKAVIDNKENHFLLQISKAKKSYTGIIDFISEQKFRIRIDTINLREDKIEIINDIFQFKITGTIDSINHQINGVINRKGVKKSISLTRYPQTTRTQKIQKPLPYISKNITFRNNENTELAGTITYPRKGKKLKAVILISGSGAQNRNSEILGHKPFEILADYLTRKGLVVLRYDDRGYGESKGKFRPATTMDYAHDVIGAIRFLKNYKNVSISKIGLIGHSEGGNIAPIVATIESDINFLILLSAPGTSNYEFMLTSLDIMFKEQYPDLYKTHVPFYKKVYKDMATIADKKILKDSLKLKFRDFARRLGKNEYKDYGGIDNYVNAQVEENTSDWWHYFLQFDVNNYLSKLKIPIFALNGDKDTDVESKSNLKAICNTLQKSGNKNFKILELKNVNHFFQVSNDNKIENVYFNEETFSKIALKEINEWIQKL